MSLIRTYLNETVTFLAATSDRWGETTGVAEHPVRARVTKPKEVIRRDSNGTETWADGKLVIETLPAEFKIGMKVRISGAEFTVTGYEEKQAFRVSHYEVTFS